MTDAAFVALVAAVPLTLTALGNIWISLRNGRKTDAVGAQATEAAVQAGVAASKADTAATKADSTATKVDDLAVGQGEIHGLVNGNLSKVKAELADAREDLATTRSENRRLHAQIDEFFAAGKVPERRHADRSPDTE